jgi:hypothetical protein
VFQQVQKFIDDHFFVMWCFGTVVCLCGFAALAWRQFKNGPQFPALSTVKVLHYERFVSGCSFRSLFTKLGGARNMLRVVLTDSELWITTIAFFRGITAKYDLDHRIPLVDITGLEEHGKSVVIQFKRGDQSTGKIQLRLADKDGFVQKLAPLLHHQELH